MDDKSLTVKVAIFGTEYSIKGQADPTYVNKLAKYVDSKMLELTGGNTSTATVRLAVLAALNVADELFQVRDELEKLGGKRVQFDDVDKKLKNLNELLDQALKSEA